MTTLLNDTAGRLAVIEAQKYLLRRRMARHWKRSLVIAWNEWRTSGGDPFRLETLVNQLNDLEDPEIRELAQLLGLVGGLTATIADMTFYINPVTGSDVTGVGTAAEPYASLWFLDVLPAVIRHGVRIIITGDLGYGDLNTGRFTFEQQSGFLSFIGASAPTVIAGPLPVVASAFMTRGGGVYVDTGAAMFVEDEHDERFIRYLTGALAGQAWPIVCNDTRRIYHVNSVAPPAPGDTFEIIEPTVSLTCTAVTLNHRCPTRLLSGSYLGERVGFYNLELALAAGAPTPSDGGISVSSPSCFSFSKILANLTTMEVSSDVNRTYPLDQQIAALSLSGVTNIQYLGVPTGQQDKLCGARLMAGDMIVRGTASIQSFVANTIYTSLAVEYPSQISLHLCGYQQLIASLSTIIVNHCLQTVQSGSAANQLTNCKYKSLNLSLVSVVAQALGTGIWLCLDHNDLVIDAAWDVTTTDITAYAVFIGSANYPGWIRIILQSVPAGALQGSVTDLYAPAGAGAYPISQVWPAAAWTIYEEPTLGLIKVVRFNF